MSKKEFVYRKEGLKLTKPDEIVVEQREDIHELREELWLYKNALKMVCKELRDEIGSCQYCYNKDFDTCSDETKCEKVIEEYFIAQAKEMMKSE